MAASKQCDCREVSLQSLKMAQGRFGLGSLGQDGKPSGVDPLVAGLPHCRTRGIFRYLLPAAATVDGGHGRLVFLPLLLSPA